MAPVPQLQLPILELCPGGLCHDLHGGRGLLHLHGSHGRKGKEGEESEPFNDDVSFSRIWNWKPFNLPWISVYINIDCIMYTDNKYVNSLREGGS